MELAWLAERLKLSVRQLSHMHVKLLLQKKTDRGETNMCKAAPLVYMYANTGNSYACLRNFWFDLMKDLYFGGTSSWFYS